MQGILQGLVLGFIIILPGMSGGTVFLMMGLYENLIADLARLRIKPYLPLLGGIILGIFIGGTAFALVFQKYRDITAALLLGSLLASVRSVLSSCPQLSYKRLLFLGIGLIVGLYVGVEPLSVGGQTADVSVFVLLIGGALSTAAMVLPGVPGSSVLIVLGIYDTMLYYIKELSMMPLLTFMVGSILGLFLLVKLLDRLYAKYRDLLSYFFAGLILGSSRALLPLAFDWHLLAPFVVGFAMVWLYSGKRIRNQGKKESEADKHGEAKPALITSN